MMQVAIEGKSLGSRKRLFEDFSVSLPPEVSDGEGLTLRDLISFTVRQQVAAFMKRQSDRQFIRVLTERDISDGQAAGKIDSGGSETPITEVDAEQAIETAIVAFEDGLYLISIDGQEQRNLDQQLFLTQSSRVTFIRLTMLAGG